jgi:hypothetical protein
MAELSNQLMALTVLAYLAAMVCYAGEYAFGDRSHIGRAAARPARQLVGAGAAVEPDVAGPSTAEPVVTEPAVEAAPAPARVELQQAPAAASTPAPTPVSQAPAFTPGMAAVDAPYCSTCGVRMRPAGSCFVCESCGTTSGCS